MPRNRAQKRQLYQEIVYGTAVMLTWRWQCTSRFVSGLFNQFRLSVYVRSFNTTLAGTTWSTFRRFDVIESMFSLGIGHFTIRGIAYCTDCQYSQGPLYYRGPWVYSALYRVLRCISPVTVRMTNICVLRLCSLVKHKHKAKMATIQFRFLFAVSFPDI